MLFETATLRSGFSLKDQVGFAERIETVLKQSMNIDLEEQVEDEPEIEEEEPETKAEEDEKPSVEEEHTEL